MGDTNTATQSPVSKEFDDIETAQVNKKDENKTVTTYVERQAVLAWVEKNFVPKQ